MHIVGEDEGWNDRVIGKVEVGMEGICCCSDMEWGKGQVIRKGLQKPTWLDKLRFLLKC